MRKQHRSEVRRDFGAFAIAFSIVAAVSLTVLDEGARAAGAVIVFALALRWSMFFVDTGYERQVKLRTDPEHDPKPLKYSVITGYVVMAASAVWPALVVNSEVGWGAFGLQLIGAVAMVVSTWFTEVIPDIAWGPRGTDT